MSAIENITGSIATIVAALEESATAATDAVDAAESGVAAMEVGGVESDIEAWKALKEQLEGIVTQVAEVTQAADEVQSTVAAIAAGT